jgi:hypothetical protein
MPKNRAHRPAQRSPQLRVEELDPISLQPYADNARVHPRRQRQQLIASTSYFGLVVPALINANSEIIAGHARVEAAKALGLNRIPCIRVEHLSKAQEKAYRLADNRLAELATWDHDLLAKELQVLTEMDRWISTFPSRKSVSTRRNSISSSRGAIGSNGLIRPTKYRLLWWTGQPSLRLVICGSSARTGSSAATPETLGLSKGL